tara:strand:+ start:511 stop:972 length:462 start_codon:yes stop_codon:yes gene_type:complete
MGCGMNEKIYTSRIYLNSEDKISGTTDNARFTVVMPNNLLGTNVSKILLYVESFHLTTASLTISDIINVRLETSSQVNSYDSSTGSLNTILLNANVIQSGDICIEVRPDQTAPIHVGSAPFGDVNIRITDADNTSIDLGANIWTIIMRVEGYN